MDEFIVPMNYAGTGLFVSVGFASLNAEKYDALEIELELTGERKAVERNGWKSEPAAFEVAEDDIAYIVKGYVTADGKTMETQTAVPARHYEAPKRRLLKAAARTTKEYKGGGIPSPPMMPIAEAVE